MLDRPGRRLSMATFDLQSILDAYGPDAGREYAAHLNPRFHDLLRLVGFDRRFVRGEGPYLWDEQGDRYLDAIGGFACLSLGRDHPVVRDALEQALRTAPPTLMDELRRRSARNSLTLLTASEVTEMAWHARPDCKFPVQVVQECVIWCSIV